MEDQLPISNLKKAFSLLGDEAFVVNQVNPVDKKLETRYTPLEDIMTYIKSEIKESLDEVMPVGSIKSYTGKVANVDSIPGWLLCNGNMVSRTKYKKLYDVIGSLYGPVAAESFALPDLRGRVIMGYCNGTSPLKPRFGNWKENQSITLGKNNQSNGVFYHQLNQSELPAHTHPNNHTHQYFNIAHLDHTYIDMYQAQGNYSRGTAVISFAPGDKAAKAIEESKNNSSTFSPDVSAYIGETSEGGGYTGTAGSNAPHNNMQPYVTVNYLIKY
jgi:microcystin-dependent protein